MNHIDHTVTVLRYLREKTDSVILFYSAGGKDSLVLLDLCSKYFKHVYCVYMYFIKGMEHNAAHLKHVSKYPNTTLLQYPHFGTSHLISANDLTFTLEIKKCTIKLDDIVQKARRETGAEWCIFGWKKADSLNRNIILSTYKFDSIFEKTKKAYPLAIWKKQDVINYIRVKNLPKPISYGNKNSQGMGISEDFLVWLRKFHPKDLQQLVKTFPIANRLLFEYDHRKQTPSISEI